MYKDLNRSTVRMRMKRMLAKKNLRFLSVDQGLDGKTWGDMYAIVNENNRILDRGTVADLANRWGAIKQERFR